MAYDPNVYSVALVDESVTVALDDLAINKAEVISLAEYIAGKGGDPQISVTETPSVAESISSIPYRMATAYSEASISEYVDLDIAGEAATEVEDGLFTQDEISAVGLYTKAVVPMRTPSYNGYCNISISGTFVGTVVLQRSFDNGVTWHTVASYTTATETYFTDKERGVRYRLGCPAAWTSGTALCRLGIGGIER